MSAELPRLVRFACVGAGNTALTLVVYAALTAAGAPPAPASAAAFLAGAVNGWTFNRRWTFRAEGGLVAAARYGLVQLLGAGASAAGVALARGGGLAHLPAELVVLPPVTLLSYVLLRRVVFRPRLGPA